MKSRVVSATLGFLKLLIKTGKNTDNFRYTNFHFHGASPFSLGYGIAICSTNNRQKTGILMIASPQSFIRMENVSKSFGSVHANREISLDIYSGKIKALLGENGAGKSTLMSILTGQLQPDKGRILIHGKMGRRLMLHT